MKTQYQILFSIQVLNHYFSSQKWREILFVPLPETGRLIREKALQIRQVQNELLVIAPVNEAGLAPDLPEFFEKFSFIMLPQSANFLNFTNLPLSASKPRCFVFNNLKCNDPASPYLTAPIAHYNSSTLYNPGTYVRANDGQIYESIKINHGTQAPHENVTRSRDYWTPHGIDEFVTVADSMIGDHSGTYPLKCTGPIFNFKTSEKEVLHHVEVYGYNFATSEYDSLLLWENVTSNEPTNFVQLKLMNFSSGVYRIKSGRDNFYIYLLSAFHPDGIPFFIEIHHLPPGDPRSLLKEDQSLKNRKYTIRFGSRSVYWKFKTRTNAINKIEDSSGDFTFKADGLRKFISDKPIPLSDAPRKTLSATTGSVTVSSPLPNPRVDRLVEKHEEIYITETFINY